MRITLCLISLLSQGIAVSLPAQHLEPGFAQWEPAGTSLARTTWNTYQQDTLLVPRRDYRYEGLAFGGIGIGALGAWIGSHGSEACPAVPGAQCRPDRLGTAVVLGLAGAAAGGGLGYLVGRLTSKPAPGQQPVAKRPPAPISPNSGRRRVGYHHWKGAAFGAAGGALLGAALLAAAGACSDCPAPTSGDFVKFELISAGVGGAFGFLVGLATPKYERQPEQPKPR
ncbi:MAG: hypothetical protein H0T90_06475 [Gemmatimonadales bacterium]|nr:hypothetical protein [Gemmatimonadales bacterium]